MKSVTAGLDTHLNGEQTSLADCWKITRTKYQPRIVGITNANPAVIETRWAHDLETGDTVRLRFVRGDIGAAVNRQEYQITKIDSTRFSIPLDTSAMAPYSAKGVAEKVEGYTGFSRDLTVNGVVYRARLGYTPESIKQGSDMSVDSIEHQGVLQNAAKNEIYGVTIDDLSDEDLIAGRYDGAEIVVFKVNYLDLTMGPIYLFGGTLGEVSLHRGTFQAELSGKTARLQEMLTEHYSEACRADLGDDLDGSEPEHEFQPGFGCKVRLDPPRWQASTAYTVRPAREAGLGSVVKAPSLAGRHFKCTVAGISGLVEPAWNPTVGGTTIDGTVTWTTIEALTKTGVVYEVIDRRRFIDNDRYEPPLLGLGGVSTLFPIIAVNVGAKRFTIAGEHAAEFPANGKFSIVNSPANDGTWTIASSSNSGGNTLIVVTTTPNGSAGGSIVGRLPELVGFFTFGRVTFLTGKNKGIAREVKAFSVTTTDGATFTAPGLFEVFEAFPFDLEVGDSYEAHAGCDKSYLICTGRFDNLNNRRAEDNMPGNDNMMLYPDGT